MKTPIMILFVAIVLLATSKHTNIDSSHTKVIEEINIVKTYIDYLEQDSVLKAIAFVESSFRPNAYNKIDDGTGILQITPIMVEEVNRIINKQGGYKWYTLDDRLDPIKSIEMFYIYNDFYNHTYPEEIARAWNSGPKWYTKTHKTDDYWEKVQEMLASNF